MLQNEQKRRKAKVSFSFFLFFPLAVSFVLVVSLGGVLWANLRDSRMTTVDAAAATSIEGDHLEKVRASWGGEQGHVDNDGVASSGGGKKSKEPPPYICQAEIMALQTSLQAQIDLLKAEINTLQTVTSTQRSQINDLNTLTEVLDQCVEPYGGDSKLTITGCNLFVNNGAGSGNTVLNGVGNIFVGYNDNPGSQTGSHNLIVGNGHTFTSYGGFLAGVQNTISAPHASIAGGCQNVVGIAGLGEFGAILGGFQNKVTNDKGAIVGGFDNNAGGKLSVVVGGQSNGAIGELSSALGGDNRDVTGLKKTCHGGRDMMCTGAIG
eukprot:gb/GEZN01010143.1/.p1 GENE.gb/GEZN01010143.1/~~gb/GEZN01010143.1/.p1  ORF type:complete len:322 (+),score=31.46 gb/GEZN01010143.1/:140-1105(+)